MKEKTKTARKETSVDLKNWGNENDLVTEYHEWGSACKLNYNIHFLKEIKD